MFFLWISMHVYLNIDVLKDHVWPQHCVSSQVCRSWCQYSFQLPQTIPAIKYVFSYQNSCSFPPRSGWLLEFQHEALLQFTGGFGPPRHEKCIYGGRVQSKSSDFSATFSWETCWDYHRGQLRLLGGFGGFGELCVLQLVFLRHWQFHMAFFIGFKKTGPWQGSSWKFLPLSAGISEATSDLHFRPGSDWCIS